MARFELSELSNGGIGATVHSSAEILFEMGVRAASGRDGAVNLVSAHMYFNLADREGDERAAFHRHEVAEQMSKIEIGRALRAARDWLAVH